MPSNLGLVVVNILGAVVLLSQEHTGKRTHMMMIPQMLLIHLAEIHSWPQKSGIYGLHF